MSETSTGTDAAEPTLETMRPTPTWDEASYEDAVQALGRDGLVFRVWAGDWCPDCRRQVPDFAAALDAAGVPADRIHEYPVEKVDGEKQGPGMAEYGVEFIPTVVVENDEGEELARFVEDAAAPIAVTLAEDLEAN